MAVTTDSASNNATFTAELEKKCQDKSIWHISNPESRVRCFNHVLNLAVQDFMKGIRATDSRKRKRRSVEDDEEYCSNEESSDSEETSTKPSILKMVAILLIPFSSAHCIYL